MALTEVDRLLIQLLKENRMEESDIVGTMLFLETIPNKIAMVKWIASKKRPTPQEILNHIPDIIATMS